MNSRASVNDIKGAEGPNIQLYTELVIDERLLIPSIENHPVQTIPMFIYVKGLGSSKQSATTMRDEYCKYAELDAEHKIPLVMLDPDKTAAEGPFVADSEDQIEIV